MENLRDKRAFRLSPNTNYRERSPTNERMASKVPNMKLRASSGREVVPTKVAQATGPTRKTNPSGMLR